MTTYSTSTLITVADAAFILATQLGPSRQWVDTLNDHRQGRGSIKGLTLQPFGTTAGTISRAGLPLYRPASVLNFVRAVRAATGESRPFAYRRHEYSYIDTPSLDDDFWRVRTVTPVTAGTPKSKSV